MSSDLYRQALHDVYTDCDVMEDDADESLPKCVQSESQKELALKFYRQESAAGKETDSDPMCNSDEEMDLEQHVQEEGQSQRGGVPSRRQDSQHIKWADDCHKELCRARPRKRYTRHPGKTIPLKSILKVMQN